MSKIISIPIVEFFGEIDRTISICGSRKSLLQLASFLRATAYVGDTASYSGVMEDQDHIPAEVTCKIME